MTVKKRLILYLKSIDLSQQKFERICSFANGFVNNIRVSISPDKLQSIALHFPELNIEWLLLGVGNMLKTGTTSKENLSLMQLHQENMKLSEEIGRLKAELAQLKKEVVRTEDNVEDADVV